MINTASNLHDDQPNSTATAQLPCSHAIDTKQNGQNSTDNIDQAAAHNASQLNPSVPKKLTIADNSDRLAGHGALEKTAHRK